VSPKANLAFGGVKRDMHYVYLLISKKDSRTYIGYSDDIKRRLLEHKNGLVKATKKQKAFGLGISAMFC